VSLTLAPGLFFTEIVPYGPSTREKIGWYDLNPAPAFSPHGKLNLPKSRFPLVHYLVVVS